MCDKTERSWEGIPLPVRQMLYLAVTKTKEVKIGQVDDAHNILDKLAAAQNDEDKEKWVKSRYPKTSLLYEELKARNELPSLKMSPRRKAETPEEKKPTTPSDSAKPDKPAPPAEEKKPATPEKPPTPPAKPEKPN